MGKKSPRDDIIGGTLQIDVGCLYSRLVLGALADWCWLLVQIGVGCLYSRLVLVW